MSPSCILIVRGFSLVSLKDNPTNNDGVHIAGCFFSVTCLASQKYNNKGC